MSDYLLVAAVDLGTTFSGYSFGMVAELEKDPTKIFANQAWVSGQKSLLSLKTPTCLLLDKHQQFKSFGYEAENKYIDIMMDEATEDYYYFYRFKMNLHENEVTLRPFSLSVSLSLCMSLCISLSLSLSLSFSLSLSLSPNYTTVNT